MCSCTDGDYRLFDDGQDGYPSGEAGRVTWLLNLVLGRWRGDGVTFDARLPAAGQHAAFAGRSHRGASRELPVVSRLDSARRSPGDKNILYSSDLLGGSCDLFSRLRRGFWRRLDI